MAWVVLEPSCGDPHVCPWGGPGVPHSVPLDVAPGRPTPSTGGTRCHTIVAGPELPECGSSQVLLQARVQGGLHLHGDVQQAHQQREQAGVIGEFARGLLAPGALQPTPVWP